MTLTIHHWEVCPNLVFKNYFMLRHYLDPAHAKTRQCGQMYAIGPKGDLKISVVLLYSDIIIPPFAEGHVLYFWWCFSQTYLSQNLR
jgi:hypothetical protein